MLTGDTNIFFRISSEKLRFFFLFPNSLRGADQQSWLKPASVPDQVSGQNPSFFFLTIDFVTRPPRMSGFVLRNGHIIDPYTGMDGIGDIYVTADGKISGIEPEVDVKRGEMPEVDQHRQHRCASLDVTGCLVTPGLIDCHVHAYEYVTPLGINIDKTCLARGVATVVDAGSAGNFAHHDENLFH